MGDFHLMFILMMRLRGGFLRRVRNWVVCSKRDCGKEKGGLDESCFRFLICLISSNCEFENDIFYLLFILGVLRYYCKSNIHCTLFKHSF